MKKAIAVFTIVTASLTYLAMHPQSVDKFLNSDEPAMSRTVVTR